MPITQVPIDAGFSAFVAEQFARNGLPPHGLVARSVGRALNHLIARHGAVIPGMEVLPASARNTASDLALWRTRYRAGANGSTLVVNVDLIPTDTGTATPAWYVKVDGTAKADQEHNSFVDSGLGLDFSDIFSMTQEVAVTADTKHTVELWTKNSCRVVGWSMHEKERDELTIATDEVVDYTHLLPLSPILDNSVQDLIKDVSLSIFNKMAGGGFSWNVDDPASGFIPANTTPTNIWDGSTARTANTVGPDIPTQYRENYIEQFDATPVIATYCWAYGKKSAGPPNGIKVRFTGAGGTTADITISGAEGIYETTAFGLVPAAGGDKVDVQCFQDTTGAGELYACGMFPLIGT